MAPQTSPDVIVTTGEYQSRYDIVLPQSDTVLGWEEALRIARDAGARGHLTFLAPSTVMGDPLPPK